MQSGMSVRIGKRCQQCYRAGTQLKRYKEGHEIIVHKCYVCNLIIPEDQQDENIYFHGNKKRSFKTLRNVKEILNRELLLNLLERTDDTRLKAFAATLYLGAFRITEVCESNLFKFQIKEEHEDSKGRKWMIFQKTLALKGRSKDPDLNRTNRPCMYAHDEPFIRILLEYLHGLGYDEPLFKFSRQYGYELLKPYNIFPHLIRPIRVLDWLDPRLYGWSEDKVRRIVGWKTMETIKNYTQYSVTDIMEQTK